MEIRVPEWLEKFAAANPSPIYLVGGWVRNVIGGLSPSDIDIAGRPLPDALTLPRGYFFATTYRRMGTALIKNRYRSDIEMEYTPFRTEEYAPGGGHTPVSVKFDTDLESDAKRRDFTVNSIYYDIKRRKLIDPFGGVADINKRIMRAHDPERVFSSDGLRLMRLVRIAAETGFGIERVTSETAMRNAALLADVTATRKRDELLKILKADTLYGVEDAHYRGLRLLREYGLLRYIIPELAELGSLAPPNGHHKYDALEHTFRTVRAAPPELRLAALMHDIGVRLKYYAHNKHSFYFILNSTLYGLSHRDMVLAAFVALGHHPAEFSMQEWNKYKDIVQEEDLAAVMKLSVILRIAESLDRSMSGGIKSINCDVLGDSVIMKTEAEGDCSLEIKDALTARADFARAYRKNLDIL